jgi:hypothetical protein
VGRCLGDVEHSPAHGFEDEVEVKLEVTSLAIGESGECDRAAAAAAGDPDRDDAGVRGLLRGRRERTVVLARERGSVGGERFGERRARTAVVGAGEPPGQEGARDRVWA